MKFKQKSVLVICFLMVVGSVCLAGSPNPLDPSENEIFLFGDNFTGPNTLDISTNLDYPERQGGLYATIGYLQAAQSTAQIYQNELILDPVADTDFVSVDHSFAGPEIINGGGFIVEFIVDPGVGANNAQGNWFAISFGWDRDSASTPYALTAAPLGIQINDNGQFAAWVDGAIKPVQLYNGAVQQDRPYKFRVMVKTSSFAAGNTALAWMAVEDVDGSWELLDLRGLESAPVTQPLAGLEFQWTAPGGGNYIVLESIASGFATMIDQFYVSAIDEPAEKTLLFSGNLSGIEGNGTGSYNISLSAEPADDVRVSVVADSQLDIIPNDPNVLLTSSNWDTGVTVNYAIIDDEALEYEHTGAIVHTVTSDDTDYDGIVKNLAIQIVDNECGAWGYLDGDFDRNCVVDLADFADIAWNWLSCTRPGEAGCLDVRQ